MSEEKSPETFSNTKAPKRIGGEGADGYYQITCNVPNGVECRLEALFTIVKFLNERTDNLDMCLDLNPLNKTPLILVKTSLNKARAIEALDRALSSIRNMTMELGIEFGIVTNKAYNTKTPFEIINALLKDMDMSFYEYQLLCNSNIFSQAVKGKKKK